MTYVYSMLWHGEKFVFNDVSQAVEPLDPQHVWGSATTRIQCGTPGSLEQGWTGNGPGLSQSVRVCHQTWLPRVSSDSVHEVIYYKISTRIQNCGDVAHYKFVSIIIVVYIFSGQRMHYWYSAPACTHCTVLIPKALVLGNMSVSM